MKAFSLFVAAAVLLLPGSASAQKDELKKQYAAILTRVLDLKYGNELGQAAMKKQLEKHGK